MPPSARRRRTLEEHRQRSGTAELPRTLGVWDMTFLGLGSVIGAGVFVLSGVAANQLAGPAVTLSYLAAAAAALLAALCYAVRRLGWAPCSPCSLPLRSCCTARAVCGRHASHLRVAGDGGEPAHRGRSLQLHRRHLWRAGRLVRGPGLGGSSARSAF